MSRGKPVGSSVRLTVNWYEGEVPVEGDFLRTDSGRCYRIDEFRARRPGSVTLGVFRCTVLEDDAVQFGDPGVFRWQFARR